MLFGHPLQRFRRRPVAPEADLEEPVAAQGSGVDQPAHGLAVPPQRAERDVAGVRVGIEVDHRDATVPDDVGNTLRVGVGDRVVTAKDDRQGPGPSDLLDGGLEQRQCRLDVSGVHLDIAGIDDLEVDQAVRSQRETRPRTVVREIVGHPDGHRSEPRARAM